MLKQRKINKEVIEFYKKCELCGKEIAGTSENQVAFNMGIHKGSKKCNFLSPKTGQGKTNKNKRRGERAVKGSLALKSK